MCRCEPHFQTSTPNERKKENMVDQILINSLDLGDTDFETEYRAALGVETSDDSIASAIDQTVGNFQSGTILKVRAK